MPGTLYLVATPIGNLEDITLRALRILREEVAAIACEDTRQTQKLLTHYEIHKPLLSYHEHNEASRTAELLALLVEGKSVALVSDAGTPLVSDPGYRIVSAAVEGGVNVIPVPGPSALLAALTASGLPVDSFLFIGFLPSKSGARRARLASLAAQQTAIAAYESPHRILDTLSEVAEIFAARPLVLARELTKLHEEFLRGTAADIREQLAARPAIKGEITLIIGRAESQAETGDPVSAVDQLERDGLSRMDAIKAVAKRMGLPKREVYRAVEEQGNSSADRNRGSARTPR
ncbi:MAG TPA: 16S rRNA (cytidine(1402)-2'-O)-methyltransferase [Bryobacteraceae bacterium]|nr:16S rRNA (cytidine(1402)-2'-O)-methyltransferase [Bryobacteraceae bacterium]